MVKPHHSVPSPAKLRDQAWLQDPRLQKLLAALGRSEARIVGGAVRNALLGRVVGDIDIATTLTPLAVIRICEPLGFGCHKTGFDHGTVTIVVGHHPFEVTTLRRDVATDGRRAVVAFTKDWREDAMRRDFTMNALYCDADGNIFDYTDGYKDIVNQKVKFVGAATTRIREDYLRILRFFRFHALYGKGPPDAVALAACTRARRNIEKLSVERVTQEILKLLAAPNPVPVLKVMASSGILENIIPHTEQWRMLGRLPADAILRLSALVQSVGHANRQLRLSNQHLNRLQSLEPLPNISPKRPPNAQRQLLYSLGAQAFTDAVQLNHAKSRAKLEDPAWLELISLPTRWPMPKFPLSGQDLKSQGWHSGHAMGRCLKDLEQLWISSDFSLSKEQLLIHAAKDQI